MALTKVLSDVDTSAASHVRGGVKSATPAVVEGVGKLVGMGVDFRRGQLIDELLGDQSNAALVEANPSLLEDASQADGVIDNLSKIASARKAGLGSSEARARAMALIRKKSNEHPFFARDIAEAGSKFFGGSSGMSGGIFSLTPEEEVTQKNALEDLRIAQLTGQSQATIRLIRGQKERNEQDIVLDASNDRDRVRNTGLQFANASIDVMGFVQQLRVQNGGKLPPQSLQEIKRQVQTRAIGITAEAKRLGLTGTALSDVVAQQRDFVDNALLYAESDSLQTLVANNAETNTNIVSDIVYREGGKFQILAKTVGEDNATLIYNALLTDNKQQVERLRQNPLFKGAIDGLSDPSPAIFRQTTLSYSKLADEDRSDQLSSQEGTLLLESKKAATAIESAIDQQGVDKVMRKLSTVAATVPEAFIVFTRPDWVGKAGKSEGVRSLVEKYTKVQVNSIKNQFRIVNGVDPSDIIIGSLPKSTDLTSTSTAGAAVATVSNATLVKSSDDIVNSILDSRTKGLVGELISVAQKHQYLWEGKFGSAIEFVEAQFKSAQPAKPLTEAPKTEAPAPEAKPDLSSVNPYQMILDQLPEEARADPELAAQFMAEQIRRLV